MNYNNGGKMEKIIKCLLICLLLNIVLFGFIGCVDDIESNNNTSNINTNKSDNTNNSDNTNVSNDSKDIKVYVYIDGVKSDTIYTGASLNYHIHLPEKPEDITTNINSEKYFYGWFMESFYQTPVLETTEFRSDSKIYGKWVDVYSNNFTYSVSKGKAVITKFNNTYNSTIVVVPAYINSFPVYAIDNEAFKGDTMIRTLILCNGIKEIRNSAFFGCNSMMYISLPNSLEKIGESAFEKCTILDNVVIPEKVNTIDKYAFAYCDELTSISVDSNNGVYDSRDNCNAVIETKNNTLTVYFKSSTIPENVTGLGSYVFSKYNEESLVIPGNITSISAYAFSECGSKIIWDNPTIKTIGPYAFTYYPVKNENARKEIEFEIPSSVTTISDHAFYDCHCRTSLSIPDNVTQIGEYVFADSTFTFSYISKNITCIPEAAFAGCKYQTTFRIPDNIIDIGIGAFYNSGTSYGNLSVHFSTSVKSIGYNAFYSNCNTYVDYSGTCSQWRHYNYRGTPYTGYPGFKGYPYTYKVTCSDGVATVCG